MRKCSQCGRELEDGEKFCLECGAPALPVPEFPDSPEPDTPPEDTAPAAPPEQARTEPAPPPPMREKPRAGAPLNFGRRLLGLLLCIVILGLLAAASLVWDLRDNSSEARLRELLDEVDASQIMASELVPGAPARQRFSEWLVEQLDKSAGDLVSVTGRQMDEFLNYRGCKDFVAGVVADFLKDIYSGKSTEAVTRSDVSDLMKENEGYLSREWGIPADRTLRANLAQALEDSGALDRLSTEELRNEHPAVYYGLFLGCSWVALGLEAVLALVFLVLLGKTWKSARRALEGFGILLIVLGGLRALVALLARLLPGVWQTLLDGCYLLPTLTGSVLYGHILIPSVALLGAGAVLTSITALIGHAAARRAARQ
ncbi:MAG: zinc-ribbon domain-containing protein [Oscillospiraceae bacterium]|nr:zinc-ribbon domain-containing protein [Oscillospiraceae bacterium]